MFESVLSPFKDAVEAVRSFSFHSIMKGNIMGAPGAMGGGIGSPGAKGNSPASNMVSNRYLSSYLKKMQEIKDYEQTDLTQTSVQIYSDYISGYFNAAEQLITFSQDVKNKEIAEDWINKIFLELDIVHEVKEHLWDILYEGSYNFQIKFNPTTQSYEKFNLFNPHNVVTIYTGKEQSAHLVTSRDGKIFQVKPDRIFRLGSTNLTLINDINPKYNNSKAKEDTLIQDEVMRASSPLYYNISGKVKEYLLKDQILALLSIKDLVQPLLLLVRLDKNTSPDEGNRLTKKIETMINKYSDISSILSSNFGINSLIDSLMNNIRVLPDYASSMGDMNNIDLSKITNKIQEIEQSQEQKKEAILTSCSIPSSLFNGQSTKWDAIKSSQRLNSKVHGFVTSIVNSLKIEVRKMYKSRFRSEIKLDDIQIHMFNKTDVDYNVAITNAQIMGELNQGIAQVMSAANQSLQEIQFIDKEEYVKYISEQLKTVDKEVARFINDETIKKFIETAGAGGGVDDHHGH